jgi:hypothetical protein
MGILISKQRRGRGSLAQIRYPVENHLNDVPWFDTEEAHCQSTSLQMIAAQPEAGISFCSINCSDKII